MKTCSVLVLSSFLLVVLAACSGSSTGTSDATDGGASGGVAKGGQTATDSTAKPSTPAPTGKSCGTADDCAYYFCQCKDGAIVNSRLCAQGSCQGPKAHCDSACAAFSHGPWTGQYGGGDGASSSSSSSTSSTSSTSSSSSSGSSGASSCVDRTDCSSFACGCTDGSRISVQDCFGGVCQTASTGCQSACSDDGRGDWDGT